MPLFTVNVNGIPRRVEADPEIPLLWVLRDFWQLTGTKYGCGMGVCGACTVHENGTSVRSCQTSDHICRCGTYGRMRRAIMRAACEVKRT